MRKVSISRRRSPTSRSQRTAPRVMKLRYAMVDVSDGAAIASFAECRSDCFAVSVVRSDGAFTRSFSGAGVDG